jgi:hypothetical protein
MAGLLDRLQTSRVPKGERQGPAPSSDISAEERKALMAQIEKAVARSPVSASRAAQDYTPRRSGLALPIIINAAALVLVGAVALLVPAYFNRQAATLTKGSGTQLSGESRLVGAVKRDAESQLRSKDAEIGQIRGTLDRTSQELDALKANAAEQVRKKEQDLRAAYESQLAAEKSRLEKSGVSSDAADRQLAALRGQLQAAHDQQLADFQKQVEAETSRRQAALSASLLESRRGLAEAEAQKAQLQAQLNSAAQAASRAQGNEAQLAARLDALNAQGQREELVIDQITASYASVASAMRASRFDDARSSLSSLSAFLDQPGVVSLAAVQRRKPVDLFLIDSLSRQIAARGASSAPVAAPAAAAPAAAASPAGTGEPALSSSQAATLARLTAFSQALAAGDAQYAAGNVPAAVERYGTALALLKEDVPGTAKLAGRIADAGFRLGQSELRARVDQAARPAVEAADELARRGSYAEAVSAYEAVVRNWPESSLVSRSLEGIRGSLDSLLKKKDEDFARREQARKSTMNDMIGAVGTGLSSAARSAEATASSAQKELIALLDAKVKVKSVLGSEAVREQYPGLADELERYLQVYGDEKRNEGRTLALQDIATVLDYLAGNRTKEALAPLWSRYGDAAGRAAFQQLLDRLRQLYP